MDDLAAERFLALPFESAFLFIALNMLRPMGLTFGFVAFSWGLGQSVTVRAGIALALALPLMILSAPGFADLRDGVQGAALPIMLVKEFALGYALGMLAGLPFLGLQFAGAVIDTYRGENAGGAPDPAGGQLPTFGLLFLIIGLFGFFASGGLWRLVGALYDSYDMWPAAQHLPRFAADTGAHLGAMVDGLLRDALVIAAPLMAILLASTCPWSWGLPPWSACLCPWSAMAAPPCWFSWSPSASSKAPISTVPEGDPVKKCPSISFTPPRPVNGKPTSRP